MPVDWSKPIQTRNGLKVRILERRVKSSEYSVVGVITNPNGSETIEKWTRDGAFTATTHRSDHPHDLVNVPDNFVFSGWMNVYENPIDGSRFWGSINKDRKDCDEAARMQEQHHIRRFACVEVRFDVERGEGL
jgi:hypothetical protein